MAIPATTPRLTADDLLQMPDDGHRYELDCGELVQLPMSSFNSSRIAVRISSAMYAFVNARGLGYIAGVDGAYILKRDPDVVRVPDVSFVRAERMPPEEQWSRFLDLAPDLAVEVISPSDTVRDSLDKVREYLDAGVQLVWVVQPSRRMVTVYYPDRTARLYYDDATLDGGDILPGFTLPVADIFA
ncbi:MAG TPA: Uma2 family endonuclease [Thermomicrobiales bacterium]|jgi:Uma2 family endonuclease|nr:Uma2 family endonuclease [Chloroflexota bacterium]HQZ90877.1 Uma2 family endonuclease [Thermomicrobiales bacterium]HRA32979.1 Uma2 family endonuclease [Thermomicrobiales bacterium]